MRSRVGTGAGTFDPRACLVLALACISISACGILGVSAEERVGYLAFYGDTAQILVPAQVAADSALLVSFHTFGGGCVGLGRTQVLQQGRTVVITPYDVHSGGEACTAELRLLDHSVSVRISAPGPAEVVVRGRVMPADTIMERRYTVQVESP